MHHRLGASEQCGGNDPVKDLLFGCDEHYDLANHICCNNHNGAEHRGFLSDGDIKLFDRLDPGSLTVFYDSVCGKPLFVAPRGRSFADFKKESIAHGWPSFRPEETVDANVNVLSGGRMESVCGTHLGHNLPDLSGARYCIDLVCIAGRNGNITGFDPDNFVSKEDNPGLTLPTYMIVLLVIVALMTIYCCFYSIKHHLLPRLKQHRNQGFQVELGYDEPIEKFRDEVEVNDGNGNGNGFDRSLVDFEPNVREEILSSDSSHYLHPRQVHLGVVDNDTTDC